MLARAAGPNYASLLRSSRFSSVRFRIYRLRIHSARDSLDDSRHSRVTLSRNLITQSILPRPLNMIYNEHRDVGPRGFKFEA